MHADQRRERPGAGWQIEVTKERDGVVTGVGDAAPGFDRL
jgi:hypothetical protein